MILRCSYSCTLVDGTVIVKINAKATDPLITPAVETISS
jgi:hypothetical protein